MEIVRGDGATHDDNIVHEDHFDTHVGVNDFEVGGSDVGAVDHDELTHRCPIDVEASTVLIVIEVFPVD